MSENQFKKRILFVGIPDMALVCLDGLISSGVNIVGVVGPMKNHPTFAGFKQYVLSLNLNFIDYDDLAAPNFIEQIKALNADLAVVCSFNYKVPKIFLDSVKDGFVNVHPSLLPNYRGANPYSAVLINNESETGVTLHFMDEGFDTGDIISQAKFPISQCETMGTLFNRANILAFDMLLEMLKRYEKGKIAGAKQPIGKFKWGKTLIENDLFIDFSQAAEYLERFVRALNPFLIARTKFRQNITKIISADIIDTDTNYEAGTIVKVEADKFYIQTGKGLVVPGAIQFGNFFAGTAGDFVRILDPKVGEKFE